MAYERCLMVFSPKGFVRWPSDLTKPEQCVWKMVEDRLVVLVRNISWTVYFANSMRITREDQQIDLFRVKQLQNSQVRFSKLSDNFSSENTEYLSVRGQYLNSIVYLFIKTHKMLEPIRRIHIQPIHLIPTIHLISH